MRRRLLALFMGLAMVSSASAVTVTWGITVNGQPWDGVSSVEPSDIIHAQWMTDPGDLMGAFTLVVEVDHGDYVPGSFYQQCELLGPPEGPVVIVGDGFQVTVSCTSFALVPDPVNGVFGFDFHVPYDLEPSTMINIAPISGNFNLIPFDQLPSAELHVVPEPMTIALLGLGGLFLRRRK